jgi:hypothetical protein
MGYHSGRFLAHNLLLNKLGMYPLGRPEMKKLSLCFCALLLVLGPAAIASAVSMTSAIANPSFEYPELTDQNYIFSVPGWGIWLDNPTGTGSAGVWNPGASDTHGYGGIAPDGQNVMFTNGTNIKVGQWLNNPLNTVTITAGQRYTLQADVGGRGPWESEAGLWYQLNLLASLPDGSWAVITYINGQPEVNEFNTVSLGYDAIDPLYYDSILGIQLVGTGIQVNFDNVQLDVSAVPEPATMFLLGSGLIGVGVFVRRKFRK